MRDEIYLQHRVLGVPVAKAAELAGITPAQGKRFEASAKGVLMMEKMRAETREKLHTTRDDVLRDLKEAYDIAKRMSEPMAMVAALREIAKVIGAYAPEKKVLEVHASGAVTLSYVQGLPDAELIRLAEAGGRVIDVVPTRVEEKKLPAN